MLPGTRQMLPENLRFRKIGARLECEIPAEGAPAGDTLLGNCRKSHLGNGLGIPC